MQAWKVFLVLKETRYRSCFESLFFIIIFHKIHYLYCYFGVFIVKGSFGVNGVEGPMGEEVKDYTTFSGQHTINVLFKIFALSFL